MELPVVVGVDGSQGSLQAVDWGPQRRNGPAGP